FEIGVDIDKDLNLDTGFVHITTPDTLRPESPREFHPTNQANLVQISENECGDNILTPVSRVFDIDLALRSLSDGFTMAVELPYLSLLNLLSESTRGWYSPFLIYNSKR